MKKLLKIFLFILICSDIHAQQIIFEKYVYPPPSLPCHNFNYGNVLTQVIVASDSNFISLSGIVIGGDTCLNAAAQSGTCITKFHKQTGDTIWTRIYIKPLINLNFASGLDGLAITNCSDHGFAIAGYTSDQALGPVNAFIMKIDSAGNQLWYHEYDSLITNRFESVIETPDFGILAGGETAVGNTSYFYVVKTNAAGNQQWFRTYGGGSCAAKSIAVNSNGTYALIGQIGLGIGNQKCIIININNFNGNELSRYYYGTPGLSQRCNGGVRTHDDKFLFVGNESTFYGNLLIIKADNAGNVDWYKALNDSTHITEALDVKETCDSGLIVVGHKMYVHNSFVDSTKALLLKLDASGNVQWEKTFGIGGGNNYSRFYSIKDYYNCAFACAGMLNSTGYLVLFDSLYINNPTIVPQIENLKDNESIRVYPNPVKDILHIKTKDLKGTISISLYNTLGQKTFEQQFKEVKGSIFIVNLEQLPIGIYYVVVTDEEKRLSSKLLKE